MKDNYAKKYSLLLPVMVEDVVFAYQFFCPLCGKMHTAEAWSYGDNVRGISELIAGTIWSSPTLDECIHPDGRYGCDLCIIKGKLVYIQHSRDDLMKRITGSYSNNKIPMFRIRRRFKKDGNLYKKYPLGIQIHKDDWRRYTQALKSRGRG